jgi:hypothetical protein
VSSLLRGQVIWNLITELDLPRIGCKKFWNEKMICYVFENVVLVCNKRPKSNFIRTHFNPLYRAIYNSNEITWVTLYAKFGLDYNEISKERVKWTFEVFCEYLRGVYLSGVKINPTSLSIFHHNFYRALKRHEKQGKIDVEQVYRVACGIHYKDVLKLYKKYPDENSMRKGIIKYMSSGKLALNFSAKDMKRTDIALYLSITGIGEGSFEKGLKKLGFSIPKKNKVFMRKVSMETKKEFYIIFGKKFELILDDLFKALKLPVLPNEKEILGVRPDFVHENGMECYDAKLTTKRVNEALIKEDGYHTKFETVEYIYLVQTEVILSDKTPSNVKVTHVSHYLNQLSSRSKIRARIQAELDLISEIAEGLEIDYSLQKSSSVVKFEDSARCTLEADVPN